ncbi:MAG TPA: serpin family protein [Gemmatimonadota bacterium]|nr:serpin family protein [Gemmatimonadota bacterium]
MIILRNLVIVMSVAVLGGTLALAACDDSPAGPGGGELPDIDLTPQEVALIEASNTFAFDAFRELSAAEATTNVFISPLSISMALGMTMNGAAGETREEMEATLGFSALTLEEINAAYRAVIDLLLGLDPAVEIRVANSIWYRMGFTVIPEFLETNRAYFEAEVTALDFASPDAVRTINEWVDRNTSGRIPEIVESIPSDVVMYLINATYFKGLWDAPFDPEATHERLFRRADGVEKPVPMMFQHGEFPYVETEAYRAADLPYGGGAFAMTVVVPAEGTSLAQLVAGLDARGWAELTEGLSAAEIVVELPRFELEYEKTLNEMLQDLGMELAFTGAADFSRLTPGGGVWIDEVKHKTFVKVDEEGTEAAAVTSVAMTTSLKPGIYADRPFLFAIRERTTGTILFIGQFVDPP